MLLRIFILLTLSGLTACGSFIASGGNQAGVYTEQDNRSLDEVSYDVEITNSVNRVINHYGYSDVYADTVRGVVKLDGTIQSKQAENSLINKIQDLPGVKSVTSKLKVY